MAVMFDPTREMAPWRVAANCMAGSRGDTGEEFNELRRAARYIGREFNLPGNSRSKISFAEVDAFERAAQDPDVFSAAANKILSRRDPSRCHASTRAMVDHLAYTLKQGFGKGAGNP